MFDDPVDYLVHYLECPDESPEEAAERIELERLHNARREAERRDWERRGDWSAVTNLGDAMKAALFNPPQHNKRRR